MITIKPHGLHTWAAAIGVREMKFLLHDNEGINEWWWYTWISENEFQVSREGDMPTNYVVHHE